jgi:acylphosphatase
VKTFLIVVSGKVQGVYYRQSAKQKALELGISGTVQNLRDGSVLLIATGATEQLNKLVDWCRQGPPAAKVTGVQVQEEEEAREFIGFTIQR